MNRCNPSSLADWPRRRILQSLAALALPAIVGRAGAQPGARTARIVVGFAPGGAGDALARGLAESLKDLYPAGLVVENRPGASGRLAVEAVKLADPDGNTLLYSPAATFTILPHAVKGGAFQPLASLQPVAAVSKQDFALALAPSSGFQSIADLLAAAKKDSKVGAYGTAGAGTPQHLIGHLLATASGTTLSHIPYKGGAAALQDTIAGHTPMCITAISEQVMSLASDGRLRIVAVAGAKRSALLPNVPTLQEQGYKGIAVEDWSGVLAPAKTTAAIVEQISQRLIQITSSAAYAASLARAGQEPLSVGPANYAGRLKEEHERWGPVVKAAGFSLDS
jgi:tripartite-type tricarboxylate transporter receptor subunit TctC